MIEFRTLGSLELRRSDGTEFTSILSRPKRLALLTYLALAAPRGFHRRDTLLGLFWPALDAEHARAALRQALAVLRRELGEEVLLARGADEVGLDRQKLWCDGVEFDDAVKAGGMERAIELYRGDLLNGFFISDAPDFEHWLDAERQRLREGAASVAWTLAEQRSNAAKTADARVLARRAIELAPDNEGLLCKAVMLLDRLGDRATAIAVYEAFAERLRKEFELEPAPETCELVAGVRARQAAGDVAAGWVPSSRDAASLVGGRDSNRFARLRRGQWAAVAAALLGVAASDLSPLPPSHDPDPVARSAVWFESSAAWQARPRIAVLSIDNLDDDSSGARFANSMTEDLTARLSGIRGLAVLDRSRVQQLEARGKTSRDIGDALRASALLHASVRRMDNQVRVVAQLVDADSDVYIWAGTFDRDIEDVFAVQAEIADSIARALRVALTDDDRRRVRRRPTQQWSAYEYSEEARRVWNTVSSIETPIDENRQRRRAYAVSLLDKALEIDPGFGAALAMRAALRYRDARELGGRLYGGPRLTAGSTEAALRSAIARDPTDPRSWRALALFYQFERRPRSALDANLRALELDPNYLYAMIGADIGWASVGRFADAARMKERVYQLWPQDPGAALARISLLLGDYTTAQAWYEHVLSTFPEMVNERAELAEIRFLQGRVADAASDMQEALSRSSGGPSEGDAGTMAAMLQLAMDNYQAAAALLEPVANRADVGIDYSYRAVRPTTNLAFSYARLGRRRAADSLFAISRELDRADLSNGVEQFMPQYDLARIAAFEGKRTEAYRWLEAAIDAGWRLYYRLGHGVNDPLFEGLREERRFQRLMAKVKAEVDAMREELEASGKRPPPPRSP